MLLLWIALGLFVAAIVLGIIFNTLRLVLRILGLISLLFTIITAGFGLYAYFEGAALQDQLVDGPIILFFVDSSIVYGAVVDQDDARLLTSDELSSITLSALDQNSLDKVTMAVDARILSADVVSTLGYVTALDVFLKEQGEVALLEAYFSGDIVLAPEPLTFRFMRTQQFVSMETLLEKGWFRRMIGIASG